MSITLEEAKALKRGDMLHHTLNKNADGTPQRWRVNGKVRRWKRDPDRIQVPIKYGLWGYDVITEDDLDLVSMGDGQ